jgi:small ubiquitin-related modifier
MQKILHITHHHNRLDALHIHTIIVFPSYKKQDGGETYFKIKKSTKMQKVFDTYASRKGLSASTLRFLYDGNRIQSNDTPKMLEMEDQDQIDCRIEQSGGSF